MSDHAAAADPPYIVCRMASTEYVIGSAKCSAANGPGSVCHGNVPPAVTSCTSMSTRPRNCPTDPSSTLSAMMIAANVAEASTMMPIVGPACTTFRSSANRTMRNSATICTTPRSAGVSQPPSTTRRGFRTAVIARFEIGLRMRNSAYMPIQAAREMKNGARPAP